MGQNQDNKNILEQSLLDYDKIEKMITKNSENIAKDILGESIKNSLKSILAEANDEFEEEDEDLDLDAENIDGMNDTDSETDLNDDEEEMDEPEETEVDDIELGDDMDIEDDLDGSDDEEDFNFDEFKTDDGEYDLTNSSIEDVIKIFKRIDGDDSVIVKKLEDDKIEVKDNETEAEYLIDLESDDTEDAVDDFDVNGDDDFDSSLTEDSESEFEIELDEDEEIEIELDGDEDILDEKPMTQSIGANRRVGKMSQTRKDYAPGKASNRDGAKLIANEERLKKMYRAKLSEINKKHEAEKKAITEEVNKYKQTLKLFSDKIKESAVLNNNLAKYVKLVTENTTTKDEKLSILRRFSEQGTSIKNSNSLYESIDKDLKGKVNPEIVTIDNKVSAEGSKKINEQVIYEDKGELKGVLSLMNRIGKL